jgi:hypothetical protein
VNVVLRRESEHEASIPLDCFPFVIGRTSDHLVVRGGGVWERHAVIDQGSFGELNLTCRAETTVQSNGVTLRQLRLKLGDTFQIGSERFRLELAPVSQRPGRRWEVAVGLLGTVILLTELWLAFNGLAFF